MEIYIVIEDNKFIDFYFIYKNKSYYFYSTDDQLNELGIYNMKKVLSSKQIEKIFLFVSSQIDEIRLYDGSENAVNYLFYRSSEQFNYLITETKSKITKTNVSYYTLINNSIVEKFFNCIKN